MSDPITFTVTFADPVIHSFEVGYVGPAGADGVGSTAPEIEAALDAYYGVDDWRTYLITGEGTPQAGEDDIQGSHYFDTEGGALYLRGAVAWELVYTFSAGGGGTETTWRTTTTTPGGEVGIDGDWYLNTVTGVIYRREAGEYVGRGNVLGASAAQGGLADTSLQPGETITLAENTSIALDPAGSADGKYSGITVAGTAGATLAFGRVITLDRATSRWKPVDITVAAGATGDARGPLGMAVTTGTNGGAVTVLLSGIVRADAAFPTLTINGVVFATTAGDITQTRPSASGSVVRPLGHALTTEEILFQPSPVWWKVN